MRKKTKVTKKDKEKYSEPDIKKHENLKDITLLSFDPPGEDGEDD